MTKSQPSLISGSLERNTSRKRRFTELRTTAFPTFLETDRPRREPPASWGNACTENSFPLYAVPCL